MTAPLTSETRVLPRNGDERTSYCWTCHKLILMDDDAKLCVSCGGRNTRVRRQGPTLWSRLRWAFRDWLEDEGHE